jgi:Phage integrase family
MSVVDVCLGLRASELFGLRWEDINWKDLRVKIQRSWVYGKIEEVKTEGSEKWLPLDSNLVEVLRRHRSKMGAELLATGWIFVNPSPLLWVGASIGMAVNGTMAGIGALMPEAYPTAARATAQNVLFNVGWAVGAPGPLAVGA